MNWLTCWGSRVTNCILHPSWITSTALRMLWKTCGLFDQSGTGVVDAITPATTLKSGAGQSDVDTTDLLSALDMGLDLLGSGSGLMAPGTETLPDLMARSPTSPDQLGQGFCDTYTDLTSFLFGDTAEMSAVDEEQAVYAASATVENTTVVESTNMVLDSAMEVVHVDLDSTMEVVQLEVAAPPMEEVAADEPLVVLPSKRQKRKHEEVITQSQVSNPDHNDYIRKDKRPRLPSDSAVVPSSPTTSYTQRRYKNNIASKRSRETRKQKFSDMDRRAVELEKQNKELQERADKLEILAKKMKDILVQRMSKA